MIFTTDDIIASVKARTLAPSGQKTFQDSDFIRFMNEELLIKIVPDIQTVREDFFLQPLQTPLVQNQAAYTMPERALGNTLKDLFWIDQNGSRFPIARINIRDIPNTNGYTQAPYTFYVQDNQVVLGPPPFGTGTLEQWYYLRCNDMVLTSACGQITAIATDTPIAGQVTYTVNANISSYTELDFLSFTSPFQLWAMNVVPVSATSSTVVVDMDDVENQVGTLLPQLGDYICEALTAPVAMIPQEFHPLLSEYVAARVVQSLGQNEKLAAINENIQLMRQNLLNTIANRIEQSPEVIRSRGGFIDSAGYGWAVNWSR
jgi:hypothetical protein